MFPHKLHLKSQCVVKKNKTNSVFTYPLSLENNRDESLSEARVYARTEIFIILTKQMKETYIFV